MFQTAPDPLPAALIGHAVHGEAATNGPVLAGGVLILLLLTLPLLQNGLKEDTRSCDHHEMTALCIT